MLQLDPRHLSALRAVAATGSFAGAAGALGYTQSAISQQIAALEAVVGQRLVTRPSGARRASLNPAGELVLCHADAIVARLQMLEADLATLAAGRAGSLRVGTYQSVGTRLLPRVVAEFCKQRPAHEIEILQAFDDDELYRELERGHLDVVLAVLPPPDGAFEFLEVLHDPYVLLVAHDSPLADCVQPLTLSQIAGLPLVGYVRCRSQARIDSRLRDSGTEPTWILRSDDNTTLQAMAAEGIGAALVPWLTIDTAHAETVAIPVGDLFPPRRLGVVWHAGREQPPALGPFTDLTCEAAARLERKTGMVHTPLHG